MNWTLNIHGTQYAFIETRESLLKMYLGKETDLYLLLIF